MQDSDKTLMIPLEKQFLWRRMWHVATQEVCWVQLVLKAFLQDSYLNRQTILLPSLQKIWVLSKVF